MDFRPLENTLEALYNPKFMNHSSVNMGLLEPHKVQQAAMGKRFHTNSREYIYGKVANDVARGDVLYVDLITFSVSTLITINNGYSCISLRKMNAGDYGVFCLLGGSSGSSPAPGPGTTDYNELSNKPIYNITYAQATAEYGTTPTYIVGERARVTGNMQDPINPLTTKPVVYECLYVYITNAYSDAILLPQYGHGYLSSYIDNEVYPFSSGAPYVDGAYVVGPEDEDDHYDCILLRSVVPGAIVYGWIWMHDFTGPITVDAPDDPLPDTRVLRRKNAKKT